MPQKKGQSAGMGQPSANAAGTQSIMEPGFAGTDPQEVRQEIQNSPNGQITSREAGSMNEKD